MEPKQKQLAEYSGEELAEIQGGEFTKLMQAQQNLMAISQELARRKQMPNVGLRTPSVEPPKE